MVGDASMADTGVADDGGPFDAGPPPPDASGECVDAVITLDSAISDTTIGGADLRDSAGDDCLAAFASGPERVYSFLAPSAGDYRITVTPDNATFDPMVYVQPSCDDMTACIAVAGLNGPGEADSTTMTLAADQAVFITVDTDFRSLGDTEGGPFTILVERAP
jgi:hypothetical protein